MPQWNEYLFAHNGHSEPFRLIVTNEYGSNEEEAAKRVLDNTNATRVFCLSVANVYRRTYGVERVDDRAG